jgi:predicted transcriptional regulator YdeE
MRAMIQEMDLSASADNSMCQPPPQVRLLASLLAGIKERENRHMNYEIVNRDVSTIAGLSARTNNQSPDMGNVIGGLWKHFYEDGIYASIPNKKTSKALGIYTDYADDEKGDYTAMVACEVSEPGSIPQGAVIHTIPAGRYAKFIVKGDMHQAVAGFWQQLWEMDLPRSFVCDFEEYQNSSMDEAEIHIYIGLKEEK